MRLNHLVEKSKLVTAASNHGHETILLFLSCLNDCKSDFYRLLKYIELNKTGFVKILKKFDKKISPGSTENYSDEKSNSAVFADESRFFSSLIGTIEETETLLNLIFQNPTRSIHSFNYLSPSMVTAIERDDVDELLRLITDAHLEHSDRDIRLNAIFRKCAALKAANCFRKIIELGASVDDIDDINERSSVHHFAIKGDCEFLRIVMLFGANLEAQDAFGRRAIHYASIYGHISCAEVLIKEGHVMLHLRDHEGYTPLFYAVIHGYTEVVKLLLDSLKTSNANGVIDEDISYIVNLEDSDRQESLLALACCYGHDKIAELLIHAGADINYIDENQETPLHHCCRRGHIECIKLLLSNKARLDLADMYSKWTPIFYCAANGFDACLQIILDHIEDPNITDTSGWTPFDHAVFRGHRRVVSILKPLLKPQTSSSVDEVVVDEPQINAAPKYESSQSMDRIYGHEYLEKTNMIRIRLISTDNRTPFEFVQLTDVSLLGSHLNLAMYNPVSPTLQHMINFPMKEQRDTIVFYSQTINDFGLNIDLLPTLKESLVLARAVVLPTLFTPLFGIIVAPLLNSGLKIVGKVTFEFRIIQPFLHSRLGPFGKHMYWKSIKV